MPSGGWLSGSGHRSRHAPQAHREDDPRERERTSSHNERKALIVGQCERGQPQKGAERCHNDGCCGPFKVQVDGIKDDGLRVGADPAARDLGRSSLLRHSRYCTSHVAHRDRGGGQKHRYRVLEVAGSDGRQPSARSALQRFSRCRLRAVSDRAVSSPNHTQRRNMLYKGSGSVAMPKDGRLLRQASQRTHTAPYAARPRKSRGFAVARFRWQEARQLLL
jgi:hypothetical protein